MIGKLKKGYVFNKHHLSIHIFWELLNLCTFYLITSLGFLLFLGLEHIIEHNLLDFKLEVKLH